MIFWGLRCGGLLVSLILLVANWRLALVLLFALAADFVTYLWMALPLYSVWNELIAVFVVGLLVGAAVAIRKKRLAWWTAPVVGAGTLVLLRGTLYTVGLAQGTITADEAVQSLPGSVVLVVGCGIALLLPAIVIRKRRVH
jgi:peptidoglycan/LPS O-acetylase OafA/YrhL